MCVTKYYSKIVLFLQCSERHGFFENYCTDKNASIVIFILNILFAISSLSLNADLPKFEITIILTIAVCVRVHALDKHDKVIYDSSNNCIHGREK